jgi:hypothetical protein
MSGCERLGMRRRRYSGHFRMMRSRSSRGVRRRKIALRRKIWPNGSFGPRASVKPTPKHRPLGYPQAHMTTASSARYTSFSLIRCDGQYLKKASKTCIGDYLHSFCSPLTKRPWDSHRIVPESLVNIVHLPKPNKSSGFAPD